MVYNILVFGKNGYHGCSIWLGQKVRIILLVVKLMDHHAFLKIAYRHFSVCILIDVRFSVCLLIANLCWWVFINGYLLYDIIW